MKKITTSIICVVYFIANCVLAHAFESNIWKERLARLPQIQPLKKELRTRSPLASPQLMSLLGAIPNQFGSIRKINYPSQLLKPAGPLQRTIVLHIQDIHQNIEAQQNIAQTISHLIDNKRVGLVAVEAGFGAIEDPQLKSYLDPDSLHKAADYLLQNNKVAGSIHAF